MKIIDEFFSEIFDSINAEYTEINDIYEENLEKVSDFEQNIKKYSGQEKYDLKTYLSKIEFN